VFNKKNRDSYGERLLLYKEPLSRIFFPRNLMIWVHIFNKSKCLIKPPSSSKTHSLPCLPYVPLSQVPNAIFFPLTYPSRRTKIFLLKWCGLTFLDLVEILISYFSFDWKLFWRHLLYSILTGWLQFLIQGINSLSHLSFYLITIFFS
jgi:hypothetical protein